MTNRNLFAELKRRNVYKVALTYAVVGWLLVQVATQVFPGTEAVQNLKKLFPISGGETVSIARLKIDPVWDAIRNDPGFRQLLAGKEPIGPNM